MSDLDNLLLLSVGGEASLPVIVRFVPAKRAFPQFLKYPFGDEGVGRRQTCYRADACDTNDALVHHPRPLHTLLDTNIIISNTAKDIVAPL
jgi:hypothetical protein